VEAGRLCSILNRPDQAAIPVAAQVRDHVRYKTDVGMINEVLAKFFCHNICCLIHALFELGIESRFWNTNEL
jgi:hypothetical protein